MAFFRSHTSAGVFGPASGLEGGRPGIRATVLLGFGLMLALWLLCALDAAWRMMEAEVRLAEINSRLSRNEQVLAVVQPGVRLADGYLHSFLGSLEPAGYFERLE